ncbi:MAG: alpha/beta hydrolase [Candidatus Vogelbacteria bacterium]|nr:alpha/beta hydrolase [Candidatus Vogelbacteria bacterium]
MNQNVESNLEIGKSFEEQFSNVIRFEAFGGEIEAVDITPPNLKSETPVLIAPGYGETPATFKPLLQTLYHEGRRAVAISHPRFGGSAEQFEDKLVEKHGLEELRKAMNLLALLNNRSVDKADVMAMSEGAINASIAAELEPEKFRNIILIGPAGLVGGDNYFDLFKRFTGTIASETVDLLSPKASYSENRFTTLFESWAYFLKNPVRGLIECNAIAKADILEMLRATRAHGIKTAVVIGVDDPVFDQSTMNSVVHEAGEIVDGFVTVTGGHYGIANEPKYAEAVEALLTSLEAKK